MAINSSTRFGVVYSTPKDFIEKIGSKDSTYTDGKLFVLHGDAEGALTQGIYMVEQNNTDPDGSLNIQMLSSGAYASSTNAGLMSAADVATLSAALSKTDASNTYLKINDASFFRTVKVINGNSSTNIVADSSRDTLTITAGTNVTLSGNSSTDTLTISATDTTYSSGNLITIGTGNNINHNTQANVTTGRYGDASNTRTLAFGDKFKVIDTSVDPYGHITNIATKELTLPTKPDNAGHADTAANASSADMVKNYFDISVNGADILTYNGSNNLTFGVNAGSNVSLDVSGSTITINSSYKNDDTKNTTGTTNKASTKLFIAGATEQGQNPQTFSNASVYIGADNKLYSAGKAVVTTDELNTALTSALQYKGTLASDASVTAAATASDKKKGDVYAASASFKPSSTYVNNWKDSNVEPGDLFIFDGSKFDIINGENQVSSKDTSIGSTLKTIATVDGTDIKTYIPVVSKTNEGIIPAADGSDGTIDNQGNDWVLTSNNNGSSIGWYKLPANAFKNDNSIYTATGDISLNGTTFSHVPSNVTAGRYGDTGDTRTLTSNANTFKVVDVSVNVNGHVTATATKTITLPAEAFQDTSYGAEAGIELKNGKYKHTNSVDAVTAYDLSTNTTASANGGVIKVKDFKYDAQGHITGTTTCEITLSENYKGTVTSITAGTGLSGGTITTDGTISLNVANSSTLGGIIASNKLTSAVTLTSSNGSTSSRYYGVQVDNTGKAFVNIPWTDYQVKANTSTGKIYLIGQDDASNGTTEQAYKNASVYMQSGKMYATSGSVASNDTALVNGGTVYAAVEAAKGAAIEAATIYWETL